MKSIRIAILALFAACLSPAALADDIECLSVTDNVWDKEGAEFGITYVHWQAELSNACETGFDADLDIRFVDEDGKVLYQSRDLVTVPRNASTTTRREFNLPDKDFKRLADVLVIIRDERERPF